MTLGVVAGVEEETLVVPEGETIALECRTDQQSVVWIKAETEGTQMQVSFLPLRTFMVFFFFFIFWDVV